MYLLNMAQVDAYQFSIELARLSHDLKSDNVTVFDLRGISSVTDFTVISTGTSERQIRAVADRSIEYGKKLSQRPYGFCGYESGQWIIVDFVDVVAHMFSGSSRQYNDLELLWGDAPRLDWARSETA